MATCSAKKASGDRCKGKPSAGSKYCGFHQKRFGGAITHGRSASAELLGIPQTVHNTFEEFHQRNKPFELHTELAYVRTLMVEQRKAMEATRDSARQALFEDLQERSTNLLMEANMKPAVIDKLIGALVPVWQDVVEGHYGPAEPLQPEQFQMLADMIEKTSRIAEKAKKIQDGITLNVDFKNVGPILIRFVREIIFSQVHDVETRQNIVAAVRSMNLLGQTTRVIQQSSEDYEDE
jgi:hypothetical protein